MNKRFVLVLMGAFLMGGSYAHADVQGFLDQASCNQIYGWAWDTNYSTASVYVQLYVDGAPGPAMLANQYRGDVQAAGYGTGDYGFSFSSGAWDSGNHTIDAKVNGISLSGSPKTVQCGSAASFEEGWIDAVNCNTISGWAWQSIEPNTPINVNIFATSSNGMSYGYGVLAGDFRGDLLAAGKGNGYHAFTLSTPEAIKIGAPVQINAGTNNGTQLGNDSGVQSITCN